MKIASLKVFQSPHKHILLIIIALLTVQAGLLMQYGIYEKEEAVKYITEAEYFLQYKTFTQPKYFFYSGYIFLHVLAKLASSGIVAVYIVQLLANVLATFYFYKLVLTISGRRMAAFIAASLLVFCIPFQKWTVYLFTESVFFSLLILYYYVLFSDTRKAYTKPLLALMLLMLLIIFRPTGMLVIPATLVLASYYLFKMKRRMWAFALWLPGLAALVFLLDTAIRGKGEFDFIKPFVEQHIICGLPQQTGNGTDLTIYENTLRGLISYIAHHVSEFTQLGFKRLTAFFGLIRPYYSDKHNMLLIASFYPVYIFASFSIRHIYMRARPFFIFSVMLIATFALSVILTCDDWHNRFIMPVMPLIFLFAGIGITNLYTALFRRTSGNVGNIDEDG